MALEKNDLSQTFSGNAGNALSGVEVAEGLIKSVEATITARFGAEEAQAKQELFWSSLAKLHREISPQRESLLEERSRKQYALDDWFKKNPDYTQDTLQEALVEIGYLPAEELDTETFSATTSDLSEDITTAGPQLVVPANDARMVLGAMNGRWGSLYDVAGGKAYSNITEGQDPKEFANAKMDEIFDFEGGTFSDIQSFKTSESTLVGVNGDGTEVTFKPKEGQKFLGYGIDDAGAVNSVLLENNGLKVEFALDDQGAVQDVVLESAVTVIVDKEDASVSALAVKEQSEMNIARLIDGTLEVDLGGDRGIRALNADTQYIDAETGEIKDLSRTAQLLVRSVSDHMKLPAGDITIDGQHVSEKTWDLLLNSLMGVEYHVLPKMHNEQEVALAIKEIGRIEELLGIEPGHSKVGVMNEEFEMNLRLREALSECRDRVFFVNSGFLDKFGSDLEALIEAGPVGSYTKLNEMIIKTEYERNNVEVSVQAGVPQVGAGMWPQVRNAIGHRGSKIGQIHDGNDVSWDPNPMMATLHAVLYHTETPVADTQATIKRDGLNINKQALFQPPLGNFDNPTGDDYIDAQQIQAELRQAIHGIGEYAKPWIEQGVGCSAIPDANGVELMEDRATGRIKGAFVRNWLHHGITNPGQVMETIISVGNEHGWSESLRDVVYEYAFNPQGRANALVDNAFMNGYRREHDLPSEDTILLTRLEVERAAQSDRAAPPRPTGWVPEAEA